jgi:diacylglycerol kinase (ATP)
MNAGESAPTTREKSLQIPRVAEGRRLAPDAVIQPGGPLMFSVTDRVKSFGYALRGLGFVLRSQHNAWIHLGLTVAVIAAGYALQLQPDEWRWIVLAIALVWVAEIVNTAFEHLCDVVQPEFHVSVKAAKDVAASAVLVASIAAAIIGVMVFWPYARF